MISEVMGHYNVGLMGLSFGVAVLASYTTLNLAGQVSVSQGVRQFQWLMGGTLAMGVGIWSMHFIAMLALQLPIPISYDPLTTGLSLFYATLASGIALWLVSRANANLLTFGISGVIMGLAIAWMHYTGMAALHMPALIQYQTSGVLLSIAIAITASFTALALAFWRRRAERPALGQDLASAVVMGGAISGMHYTAMAATHFIPNTIDSLLDADLARQNSGLAIAVGTSSGLLLIMTLMGILFAQQMTQQRIREAALEASELRFRDLIREMRVGVLLLNEKAEILVSNQAAARFFQLAASSSEPQVFGQGQRIQREDGALLQKDELPVQQAIAQRKPIDEAVIGIYSDDDGLRWLLVNIDPQVNAEGQVERVVCTFSDITAQKYAEDALRTTANRERAVMRIVQQMRQTLDLEDIFTTTTRELRQEIQCDRVWIYRFQPDWSGIVVSESLVEDAGLSGEAIATTQELGDSPGCTMRELESAALSTSYLIEDTYLQETKGGIYRQGLAYRCVNDIYTENFDPCYREFLESLSARAYIVVPIFAGPYLWGLLGVYQHDLPRMWTGSEVKTVLQIGTHLGTAVQQADLLLKTQQQAQALEVAKEAADAANRAKSDFLASMSHEFRTPLNAILGFTQLLDGDPTLDASHRDFIGIISRSGHHLLGLINDVLSMSKIEANQMDLDEAIFDLYQLLNAVEDMLQFKAESKGLSLTIQRSPQVPQWIYADGGKIRQILINLLNNAIKFTHEGGVSVDVSLITPADASLTLLPSETTAPSPAKTHILQIRVTDTGVGIASDEIADLFKPFTQTQAGQQAQEGTGLGLSISDRFVQLMQGTTEVTSTVGVGSRFTVTLPVGIANSQSPSSSSPVRSPITHLAPDQGTYRILIVDDLPESRLILTRWLSDVGFEVREATNGEEAIALWNDWSPHLICMDMQMPVLDGYAAAQQIRRSPNGDQSTIIAVTASAFEEQQVDSLAAGCNDFLPKPLQRELLLERIGSHLGLTYQYGDRVDTHEPEVPLPNRAPPAPSRLTAADFDSIPDEWVAQIRHAAQAADDRRVRQLIRELPPTAEVLVQPLEQLVNDFRMDIIISLTQRYS